VPLTARVQQGKSPTVRASRGSNQAASVSEQARSGRRWGGHRATPSPLQLIEWGRQDLATARFEAVYTAFQGRDVCFESVDVLVELAK
jgi:hypothetical protein